MSCESALCRLIGLIAEARRLKKDSVLVSIDFARAFDSLDINTLLTALRRHSFGDAAVMLMKSYLTGRVQQTKYGNALSSPLPLTTGVPEGSLFSPLLLNIYIDSLLTRLPDSCVIAYADDVSLVCSHKSMSHALADMQALLCIVGGWAADARLVINVKKCALLCIPYACKSSCDTVPVLSINGLAISLVNELKLLGITFTFTLDWTVHADIIRTKILHMSGVLQRFGCTLDLLTRQRVFNAYIMPHILYYLPVWGNLTVSHCHLFNRTLLGCAKMIQRNVHAELDNNTFKATGILPFRQFVFIRNVSVVIKILSNNECQRYFHTNCFYDVSQHITRQHDDRKILAKKFTRVCDKHNFIIGGISDWNELPTRITAINSFNLFKKNIYSFSCDKL